MEVYYIIRSSYIYRILVKSQITRYVSYYKKKKILTYKNVKPKRNRKTQKKQKI